MEGRRYFIHYCQLRDRECLSRVTSAGYLHANDVMFRVNRGAILDLLARYQNVTASFLDCQLHDAIELKRLLLFVQQADI